MVFIDGCVAYCGGCLCGFAFALIPVMLVLWLECCVVYWFECDWFVVCYFVFCGVGVLRVLGIVCLLFSLRVGWLVSSVDAAVYAV